MSMGAILALLGGATPKKNRRGRPTKASMGLKPDDIPGWMFFRACVALHAFEHARAEGKTRQEAQLAAIDAWQSIFPMGRLSRTEVDNILRNYQPEDRPGTALRVSRGFEDMPESVIVDGKMCLTGQWKRVPVWVMRFDVRPPYPKRGSGRKTKFRYSKRFR
ncbi:MAG: hypothetical protein LDL19_00170 [Thiobacillus sp.]|nr:hypothetical protein [Thiobacillus sp.]